jgi:hypothetical protein
MTASSAPTATTIVAFKTIKLYEVAKIMYEYMMKAIIDAARSNVPRNLPRNLLPFIPLWTLLLSYLHIFGK